MNPSQQKKSGSDALKALQARQQSYQHKQVIAE
jgi:hypothetical protein